MDEQKYQGNAEEQIGNQQDPLMEGRESRRERRRIQIHCCHYSFV